MTSDTSFSALPDNLLRLVANKSMPNNRQRLSMTSRRSKSLALQNNDDNDASWFDTNGAKRYKRIPISFRKRIKGFEEYFYEGSKGKERKVRTERTEIIGGVVVGMQKQIYKGPKGAERLVRTNYYESNGEKMILDLTEFYEGNKNNEHLVRKRVHATNTNLFYKGKKGSEELVYSRVKEIKK